MSKCPYCGAIYDESESAGCPYCNKYLSVSSILESLFGK